jgi:signal transduction histidine kinase
VAGLSIAVSLATVGLLTRHVARSEFRVFEVEEHRARVVDAAELLASRLPPRAGPAETDAALRELGRSLGHGLLLLGADGATLGASSPGLRRARVRRTPDGGLALESEATRAGIRERRMLLAAGPQISVRRADGSAIGTLFVLPLERGHGPAAPFGGAFDFRLLVAAALAALVALALSWALSRRLLGPVEALTAAARRLGAGDLSARVPPRGEDEIGQLTRAFNTMAENLARQESLRRTLVTDVAHELRTPLTHLRGQLEAVEDGLLPASPETLRSLREEVMLLARLVDDLQTLSVAEAGRLALDRAPVSVRDLVEGAVEGMKATASARGVVVHNRIGDLPPVLADATRIAQVLRNLLANAMTHTPAGGTIELTGTSADGQVHVAVTDTGAGIAPEHLPHVFERFNRADPSRARATGGAGLGLAIVRSIVEAHGGTIGVTSEVGRGTTVRFGLPAFIVSS